MPTERLELDSRVRFPQAPLDVDHYDNQERNIKKVEEDALSLSLCSFSYIWRDHFTCSGKGERWRWTGDWNLGGYSCCVHHILYSPLLYKPFHQGLDLEEVRRRLIAPFVCRVWMADSNGSYGILALVGRAISGCLHSALRQLADGTAGAAMTPWWCHRNLGRPVTLFGQTPLTPASCSSCRRRSAHMV